MAILRGALALQASHQHSTRSINIANRTETASARSDPHFTGGLLGVRRRLVAAAEAVGCNFRLRQSVLKHRSGSIAATPEPTLGGCTCTYGVAVDIFIWTAWAALEKVKRADKNE